jgi:hypothetical protein
MPKASDRELDGERLRRLRRMMDLEHERVSHRRSTIER